MELALDEQRVDDAPGVVARDVAHEADVAGLGVDLDDGDVGAERERRDRPVERRRGGQGGAAVERCRWRRRPRRASRRACRRRGSCPTVGVEHDVGDIGLEALGGDAGGRRRRARRRPRRPRPHRSAATVSPACHRRWARRRCRPTRRGSPRSGGRCARRRSSPTPSRGPGRAGTCRCRRRPCRRRRPRSSPSRCPGCCR